MYGWRQVDINGKKAGGEEESREDQSQLMKSEKRKRMQNKPLPRYGRVPHELQEVIDACGLAGDEPLLDKWMQYFKREQKSKDAKLRLLRVLAELKRQRFIPAERDVLDDDPKQESSSWSSV